MIRKSAFCLAALCGAASAQSLTGDEFTYSTSGSNIPNVSGTAVVGEGPEFTIVDGDVLYTVDVDATGVTVSAELPPLILNRTWGSTLIGNELLASLTLEGLEFDNGDFIFDIAASGNVVAFDEEDVQFTFDSVVLGDTDSSFGFLDGSFVRVDLIPDPCTGPSTAVGDSDGDGVIDCFDACPGFDDLLDTDGDSVPDCLDVCPGEDDLLDSDGDGVPDCLDVCPGEDDLLDSDGDSVPDCADNCPNDPNVVNTDSGMVYGTLAEAIADASPGDTLQLGACVFDEAGFELFRRDLTIRGRGMGETIIDAQGEPRIFQFQDDSTTVEDMSLVNTVAGDAGDGVALLRRRASPAFNRVEMAGHDGTGRPTTLIRSTDSLTGLTLNGCWIHSNTAGESGSMILLIDSAERTTIVNTVFANNAGATRQAVVRFQGNVNAAIVNSTFAGNGAADAVRIVLNTSSIDIVNTVADIPLFNEGGLVTATNNVFPGATGDNIDAMPAFNDPADGDYTLRPGSPGVDFGDPGAYVDAGGGEVDVAGNPRVSDDPNVPNAFELPIDAGAFEYQAPDGGCSAADIAFPLGVLDLGDIDAFIAGFSAGDPVADIADPIGVLDLDDIDAFITAFTDGCL